MPCWSIPLPQEHGLVTVSALHRFEGHVPSHDTMKTGHQAPEPTKCPSFVTKVLTNMTKVPKLRDQRQTGNSVVSPTGFEPVTH